MPWGLEIASDSLRLCRAELHAGRIRVRLAAEAPVPAGTLRSGLREQNVLDPAAFGSRLRDLAAKAGCRGWVRVALPDAVFVLRALAADAIPSDPAEARQFLRWQAKDILPFPSEEARLDFLSARAGPDGRSRRICLIARERILAEYEALLEAAGLAAATLDASSVSLAQTASAAGLPPSAGLLTGGGGRATLLVVQDGSPRFWRQLILGTGEAGNGSRLAREVADSLIFFRETEGVEPVERLLVQGMDGQAAKVATTLIGWTEVPTAPLDFGRLLRAEGTPVAVGDPTRWGAALGAAIRPW
jgi:Tfp pilus assembly PilM family ATPase